METFIVRVYRRFFGQPDKIAGLTEHVETGEKRQFEDMEQLSSIILEKEPRRPGKPEDSRSSVVKDSQ